MKRVIIVALALCACSPRIEDESTVFIMPLNCSGDIDLGPVCSKGDYPADTSFVVIYSIEAPDIEIVSETCSIEQIGERELRVHTSWRRREKIDTVQTSYFECDDLTPPLTAGIWTIHHGSGRSTLLIPSSEADTVCVFGADQSGEVDLCTKLVWGD